MTSPWTIALGGEERVPDVGDLWRELHVQHVRLAPGVPARSADESWHRQQGRYREYFRTTDSFLLIALDAHARPRGYAMVHLDRGLSIWQTTERIATVETLAVSAEWRGRGLGTALLDDARRIARQDHGAEAWLSVLTSNDDALRFYDRAGFTRFSVELRHT